MLRMTIYGFYKYKPSIFNNITLPAALDLETLKSCIFDMSGDLYTYIQNAESLEDSVYRWFARKKDSFERMAAALAAEYNPIENYDRHEETGDVYNEHTNGETHDTRTGSTQSAADGEIVGESTDAVSAYNSNAFQPDSKNNSTSITTNTASASSNDTSDGTTENTTHNENTHTSHIHGNIGLTTSQQMIEAEVKLRMYDLYEAIAKEFEDYFLIRVY